MLGEIRTVVAVTEPLLAAGPKAVTHSPTDRAAAVALCVVVTGVVDVVVTFTVVFFGAAVFFVWDFDVDFDPDLVVAPRGNDPGERS